MLLNEMKIAFAKRAEVLYLFNQNQLFDKRRCYEF